MITLDDIRAAYPHLGIALYAFEPGLPVTLEILPADGKSSYTFKGATEAAAIAAFAAQMDDEPAPPVAPVEPTPPPIPMTSVFD